MSRILRGEKKKSQPIYQKLNRTHIAHSFKIVPYLNAFWESFIAVHWWGWGWSGHSCPGSPRETKAKWSCCMSVYIYNFILPNKWKDFRQIWQKGSTVLKRVN